MPASKDTVLLVAFSREQCALSFLRRQHFSRDVNAHAGVVVLVLCVLRERFLLYHRRCSRIGQTTGRVQPVCGGFAGVQGYRGQTKMFLLVPVLMSLLLLLLLLLLKKLLLFSLFPSSFCLS